MRLGRRRLSALKVGRSMLSLEITMRNPKQTIAYLNELQTLGFTDEAFWRIHHFREKGEKESINGHRSYCQVRDSFLDEGTNERVQIRLEIVLTYFKRYFSGNTASG